MRSSFLKRVIYTMLDLVTLQKGVARQINGMTIRFPAKWSRYYEANYEAENYQFLKQFVKPGMHIIDIGAHLGLFSASSSQLAGPSGKIICFEPTPGTFVVLKNTLRLNHCNNVTPIQAAISDKEGTATFYVNHLAGSNTNSLVKNKPGKELSGYPVQLLSIDKVVADYSLHPSLIKVDAEGAELDVLKGSIQTMKKIRPVLILGLHPEFITMKGDSLKEIWSVIKDNNYKVVYNDQEMSETAFIAQKDLFDVHLMPA